MPTATPTPTLPVVPLPTWTDPASIASYITTIIGVVVAIVALVHPGFKESSQVQSLVPTVASLIAGAAQIVNVITHRSVQKAALVAQAAK